MIKLSPDYVMSCFLWTTVYFLYAIGLPVFQLHVFFCKNVVVVVVIIICTK